MRVDEFGNEIVRRFFAKIDNRTLLHDAAFVHEHDFVAEISGFGQIVRDEQRGLLQTRENFLQIFLQRGAHERIERAERLVEQQQFRRKHERAHQADALTLPAGKFDRIATEQIFRKSCQRAQFRKSRSHFFVRFSEMSRHQKNVRARGQMRKQTAFLNDVTDSAAQHVDLVRRDRSAVEFDCAGVRFDQANDEAQQRRFAATARPDQNRRLAALDREICWLQRRRVAVTLC